MITETYQKNKKTTATTNPQHFAKTDIKAIAHVLKRCIKPCA